MKRVLFITRVVQAYRAPFHERVRAILGEQGVDYMVAQGDAEELHRARQDTVQLPWAKTVSSRFIGVGGANLIWQPLLKEAHLADLVIIGQENKYLLNYLLQAGRTRTGPRIALFGHGKNFQARNPNSLTERWKRLWAIKCDWWFAYTDETRRHLEALGFPPKRITVFNNAVDTTALRETASALRQEEVASALSALGAKGDNLAIFVGGLYPDKRLEFLITAAERVRARIPDFELVVVGGGMELARLQELAASRPWIFVAGPRFGGEKAALMRGAKLFLMPGLVGLAILDAAALGLPMVTTTWPWHSPEIAYLKDGENGTIVRDWQDCQAYADAVADLLLDDARRADLTKAAYATAQEYTIEAMAGLFADGVTTALLQD